MSKIKVNELAKQVGLANEEVISKLKEAGINVNDGTSVIEGDDFFKAGVLFNDNTKKSTAHKKEVEQPHIIRRQVRVIKTDVDGNQVEQITTKAHGEITQEVITQPQNVTPKPKQNINIEQNNNDFRRENNDNRLDRNDNSGFNDRRGPRMLNKRNVNVIVTKGGKPVESPVEEVVETAPIVTEPIIVKEDKPEVIVKKSTGVQLTTSTYRDQRPRDNNQGFVRPNNGYTPNNNRTDGNTSTFRNNTETRRPEGGTSTYRNNTGGAPRPSGNSTGGYRPMGQGRPNNTVIEKKPITSEMKSSLFNKPKEKPKQYDNSQNSAASTAIGPKKNKNQIKEQQSRIDTSKLKGLSVGSEEKLLELYERKSDFAARRGNRNNRRRDDRRQMQSTKIIPLTAIEINESLSVGELATAMKKTAGEIIKKLFALGIMATVNQDIDFDTAFLVASEFGISVTKKVNVSDEDILFDDSDDDEGTLVARPPIVVVMGHVDHGKTSLLDAIKETNVVSGEAGGITQHIGAYKVKVKNREITFLDTPGHEAFTSMRARGAQVTDIAILIVAADDGIMPQTIEAINHAKDAGVDIIVAINKIDKPEANIEKVKHELMEHGLVSEEWGGTTICCPISAKTGEGIENLLEMVALTADMKELKTNPDKQAKGTILEAKVDKTKGTLVSVLVQRGTLNIGDTIVVGEVVGKVRAMIDDKGNRVEAAGPSTPVEILGLSTVPSVGDVFYEVENEKVAKRLVAKRQAKIRQDLIVQTTQVTLEDLFSKIKDGEVQDLKIIVKADVQGSLEALMQALEKLSNEEVRVRIIHSAVGGIVESDITLASVSGAIIIAFNVRPDSAAKSAAEANGVDMRMYRVIYDAINDVESAMKGMLAPVYEEVLHGTAAIRTVFKLSTAGVVAGSYVTDGKILRKGKVRIIRDSIVIYDGDIESIKREKDDAKEVKAGYECGIKIAKYTDIKEGDTMECYTMEEIARK